MLAATLIACMLNVPLADVDGFAEGKVMQVGNRTYNPETKYEDCKKVLVVDDTCWKGVEINRVKEKLSGIDMDIIYCVVYRGNITAKDNFDIYLSTHSKERKWLWNIMHHNTVLSLDMDGVICEDPPRGYKPYTTRYEDFLLNAKPLTIPSNPNHIIITGRLDCYRTQTEEWLKINRVQYSTLLMKPTKLSGVKSNGWVKAKHYMANTTELFIESNDTEAQEIAKISGKPVFCLSSQTFYNGR